MARAAVPEFDLAGLEAAIAALGEPERAELDRVIAEELALPFLPNPGPQAAALASAADVLLYGGQAGGGKSALEIGCAVLEHREALILRREAVQLDGLWKFAAETVGARGWERNKVERSFTAPDGRVLKFAGLNDPDDWRKHAGNARDYYAFDEAAEFLEEQVASLIGWLRSTVPGQRCRVILGSNPPRGAEGAWILRWFAPWLDPLFADPATPGELRWAIYRDAGDGPGLEWVAGPGRYERENEAYEAKSYSFIPASLNDNPYLRATTYRATLQNLPEPLRSQLLHGDFLAGRRDDDWQVIPSAWVRAAMARCRALPPAKRRMVALSADIAMGGRDNLVIGALCETGRGQGFVVAPLEVVRGVDIASPHTIAQHMLRLRRDGADVSVDYTGGWGSGVKSHLERDHSIACHGIVYSAGSGARTADGKLGFANFRAEMFWTLREALDPEGGAADALALPDDAALLAELTAPRWKIAGEDRILIEAKDDIRKRLGASTDRADVVAMLWSRRHCAALSGVATNGKRREAPGRWISARPDANPLEW